MWLPKNQRRTKLFPSTLANRQQMLRARRQYGLSFGHFSRGKHRRQLPLEIHILPFNQLLYSDFVRMSQFPAYSKTDFQETLQA